MKLSGLLMALAISISGCSTVPEQITLNPEINVAEYTYDSQLRASVLTVDQRVDHYLISIQEKGKEVRQLIASGSNIRQQIQEEVSEGLLQQGLNQVELSPTAIKVTLLHCHADLIQNNFSYEGVSNVQLKVTVTTPQGEIAKSFKSEQKFEEAFNIDLAKVQRNLNEQLASAIERLLADEEIRNTINKNLIKE